MKSKKIGNIENLESDVVIIGAGGAGLAAAVAASEKGISVILLEKLRIPGGNAALAQAFFAAESPVQKRMGIDAPKDTLFKMAMDYAHWGINPRIVRAFINKSGDTVGWLEEKGLKIEQMPAYPPNIPIRTFHSPLGQGAAVTTLLTEECERLGVRILCHTTAKSILMSSKGEVQGVIATGKQKDIHLKTNCVVIATGGYGGNKDLLKQYYPSYTQDIRSMGLPHQGDGLQMAIRAGAATEGLGILQMEGPIFQGGRGGKNICQEPTTIWVNKKGERFTDEASAINHFESVNALLQQPGKVSYTLFDDTIKHTISDKVKKGLIRFRGSPGRKITAGPQDVSEYLLQEARKGTVKISDSWAEIASWIEADSKVLQSTVTEYNSFCDGGYDEHFLKEKQYLAPLKVPPYYAMRCYPVFLTTIGGIKINHRMEVLDRQDNPIAGLYAVGNDTGGWEPATYDAVLSGSTFGFALNSGRIAGENAVKYVSHELLSSDLTGYSDHAIDNNNYMRHTWESDLATGREGQS